MSDFGDTISSEGPIGPVSVLPEAPRRRTPGVRATAISAVLTLVVATGVAVAASRDSGGGTQPSSLIPSSAFAVATVDLSLPGGQADSLEKILGYFPGVSLPGDGSTSDRILRAIFANGDPTISYDTDIQPWLGDHAAVAGWDNDGKPAVEFLLESRDDDSARQHLQSLVGPSGHVEIHDGYAVLGSSAADIEAALAAADKSSLEDTGPYDADIASLPANEAITGWFDGPAAKSALSSLFGGSLMGGAGAMAFSGLGGLGSGTAGMLNSRVAAGVHVTDTSAQLDFRSFGGTSFDTAPATMLTDLPTGTIGALEVGDPGGLVDGLAPVIQLFGSFARTSFASSCSSYSLAVPGVAPALPPSPSVAIPLGTPHRRAILRQLRAGHRRALVEIRKQQRQLKAHPDMYNGGCTTSVQPSTPTDLLGEIKKTLGISFPADVKTILGDRAVLAYGGLQLGSLPEVALRTHPSDLAAAQSLSQTLSAHVAAESGLQLASQTAGDDLVLATSSDYAAQVAQDGALGDTSQAKTALDGMPDDVAVAGYLDLSRLWPLIGSDVPSGLTHLKAVGLWAGGVGDAQGAQLRLVFG